MILVIKDEDTIRQISVRQTHKTIPIGESEVSVIQSTGRWHIHLPYALISEEHTLTDGKTVILKERENKTEYTLIMYEDDTGFDQYHRYVFPDLITLSEDSEGNTCISSAHKENEILSVMRDVQTIHTQSADVAVNERIISDTIRFRDGDMITFCNLRMFMTGESVFINACENIHIQLDPFPSHEQHTDPVSIHPLQSVPALDQPVQTEMKLQLPEPEQKSFVSEERPLLYTIGPSLMMSGASLCVGTFSAWNSYMQGRNPADVIPMLVLPLVMVVSTLLWNPLTRHAERKKRKRETEEILYSYRCILASYKEEIRLSQRNYRQQVEARFPYPEKLMSCLKECTVHELHGTEKLYLRAGDSTNAFHVSMEMPRIARDPQISEMINNFTRSIRSDSLQPWLKDFRQYRSIGIRCGEKQEPLFEYLILQMYWVYGIRPVFLIHDEANLQSVWIRKLATCVHQKRMILQDEEEAVELCQKDNMILVSDYPLENHRKEILCLMMDNEEQAADAGMILDPDHDLYYDRIAHTTGSFCFHVTDPFNMERITDRILPERYESEQENGFLGMYECSDAKYLNLEDRWEQNDVNVSLKAYLGKDEHGNLIVLDLNEKKDGPHGLIAGMTGSGKSELIITMLLSLAVNYSPQDVQFALIDFKGGGISQAIGCGETALPHIAGILTNLDTEEMERALISFHQECIRREKLIAAMNSHSVTPVMNLQDYRRNWSEDMNLPYLADLIIVIDEFAELKRERPEFLKDLISIARIGRSLGVHLILSTQKPGGSVSDEIWTNCSFKICLKVSQRQDSFEMLHNEQACQLREAGSFLLLSDGKIRRGRAAYANMRHPLNSCHVSIHDETGRIIMNSASFTRSGPPEIISVLNEIRKNRKDNKKADPLWMDPLQEKSVSDVPYGTGIYGQYDDYHHQSQPWMKIPERGSMLFITMNPEERKKITDSLLYAFLSSMKSDEELYLINDTGMETEEWRKIRMFTDSFASVYEDKRKNVLDRILYRRNSKEKIVLMIDDLSSFLASDEENSLILQNIIEQADSRNTVIILMNGVMQKVPYRIAGLITERYVLQCEKPQEVQQVLECSRHHVQKKKGWGLLKKDTVMEFRYLTCSEEEIRRLAMETIARYGNEKTYCIPCMPEKIRLREYRGTRIPLGLKERDFTWCTIPPVETVSVVAMYPEELERIHALLSPYSKCRYPEEKNADDAQVLLMDFDTWTKEQPDTEAVLLIGDAFLQQFVYRCRKKELKKNEALFCHGHEREVIRIVEE